MGEGIKKLKIPREPLILDGSFTEALDQMEHTDENYFITGKAGTGKSTLLKLFTNTTKKNVVVLAPTGIAALNVLRLLEMRTRFLHHPVIEQIPTIRLVDIPGQRVTVGQLLGRG